jgi:tetratricopeptide (TPR) repeat protein
MVMFDRASHCIYEEEPDKFFETVQRFIRDLPAVSEPAVLAYKNYLVHRENEQKSAPDLSLEAFGWGRSSNEKMAKLYSRGWLAKFKKPQSFLKIGFALYDVENYEEALFVFERMQDVAKRQPNRGSEAMALIWQGHMLDLLGKRDQAVKRYQRAVDMNIKGAYQHDQFGIRYSLSPYAAERAKKPFKRIENRLKD